MKPSTSDLPMVMYNIFEIGLNVNVNITVFLSLPYLFIFNKWCGVLFRET